MSPARAPAAPAALAAADDLPPPELICALLRGFYALGWCTASGGGVSIASADRSRVYCAPSGVQKERVRPEDVFVLDARCAGVLSAPEQPGLRVSECAPLFAEVYRFHGAGAVIHSHAIEAVVISRMFGDEFRVSGFEMAKALPGCGNVDEVVVPIVENTEREVELVSAVRGAVLAYPESSAVIVRNHGVYVWGETWGKAKTTAEGLHYLFAVVERLHVAGVRVVASDGFWRAAGVDGRVGLRAWFMDGGVGGDDWHGDIRAANRDSMDYRMVAVRELEALGVGVGRFDARLGGECARFKEWKDGRQYNYDDVVVVSREAMGDKYDGMVRMFADEHFHDAAEVRAVLDGSGALCCFAICRRMQRGGCNFSQKSSVCSD
jgi:methylthioribulose-1-phosphate dehydratase